MDEICNKSILSLVTARLKKQFSILDVNGDGRISLDELQSLLLESMGDEGITVANNLLPLIDMDHNGVIDFHVS